MFQNYIDLRKMDLKQQTRFVFLGLVTALLMSVIFQSAAYAGTTGTEFKGVYDFIYGAATGYLGRAICIFAGIVGLGIGAAMGKAIPAIIGVILAIFGTLGPAIVNSLFKSAII